MRRQNGRAVEIRSPPAAAWTRVSTLVPSASRRPAGRLGRPAPRPPKSRRKAVAGAPSGGGTPGGAQPPPPRGEKPLPAPRFAHPPLAVRVAASAILEAPLREDR